MIKQLLNSVLAKIVICRCLADQLFADAEGRDLDNSDMVFHFHNRKITLRVHVKSNLDALRHITMTTWIILTRWRIAKVGTPHARTNRNGYLYTAKSAQPVLAWWKQHWAILCCPHCSSLSTILFNIVTPDCRTIQAHQLVQYCWQSWTMWAAQHCSILFSFRPEQVVRFLLCTVFTAVIRHLNLNTLFLKQFGYHSKVER